MALADEREVSKKLLVSRATLRYWRARGQGPPWFRLESKLVRYDVAALREWIERQAGVRDGE